MPAQYRGSVTRGRHPLLALHARGGGGGPGRSWSYAPSPALDQYCSLPYWRECLVRPMPPSLHYPSRMPRVTLLSHCCPRTLSRTAHVCGCSCAWPHACTAAVMKQSSTMSGTLLSAPGPPSPGVHRWYRWYVGGVGGGCPSQLPATPTASQHDTGVYVCGPACRRRANGFIQSC